MWGKVMATLPDLSKEAFESAVTTAAVNDQGEELHLTAVVVAIAD